MGKYHITITELQKDVIAVTEMVTSQSHHMVTVYDKEVS